MYSEGGMVKTLFFLNKLDIDFLPLAKKLREKGEDLSVILIQDAIYLGLRNNGNSEQVKNLIEKGVKFHTLDKDVERRGVINNLMTGLELIDYDRLIDLLFSDDQKVINM